MNCTVCYSVMENWDERHPWPGPGSVSYRMNLHCRNKNCLINTAMEYRYGAYVQVIVTPDTPWRCHEYGLPFYIGGLWFVLFGQWKRFSRVETRCPRSHELIKRLPAPVPFIPISTGDDMHEHARRVLFEIAPDIKRFEKLTPFV